MMLPLALLLHTGARIGWTEWSVHPSTVVGLAILGGLYFWRARRGRETAPGERSPSVAQRASFVAGLVAIFLALNGPLHDLSDSYLFSAHMVQHLVLTMIAPPLLLVGTPGWMLRPLLDVPVVGAVLRRITRPIACYAIFNLTIAAWHVPALYNLAIANHAAHIAMHLMFMAAAVLAWWPYLSPMPELPPLPRPGQILYSFLMGLPMSIVAVYITYADGLLYPAYASAPRVWGISPMEDQLIGGLIMWIPGGLVFIGVMTVVFFKWAAEAAEDPDTGPETIGPGVGAAGEPVPAGTVRRAAV